MRHSLRAGIALGGAYLLLLVTGCPQTFRADTILHSDGSIERAIIQPRSSTPQQAQSLDVWIGYQPDSALDQWPKNVPGFPKKKDENTIAIWGRFASVDQIPSYFQSPTDRAQAATLQRSYTKTDLVFATQHRWKETLTDIVDLSDARVAAREAVHLWTEHGVEVFSERFGPDYDFSDILQWADTEGVTWFLEAYDALVQSSFQHGDERWPQFLPRLNKICESHGLKIRDASGRALGDERFSSNDGQVSQTFKTFVLEKLRTLIRRHDGGPVEQSVFDELISELEPGKVQVNGQPGPPSQLELAHDRVLARKYGGKEAGEKQFESKLADLMLRVLGVHLPTLGSREFRYSMRVPGFIIETNGQLKSVRDVLWIFNASLAFPAGYDMYCESVEPDAEAQRQLLGDEPLNDQASVVDYRNLVTEHPALLDILRQCREQNSMQPLQAAKIQSGDQDQPANLMWDLLREKGTKE